MYSCSWISNVTNPCLEHLKLAAACCAALVAAVQQWWRQQSARCRNAGGPAVGYEHALRTPLFCSEHSGSPAEAADDAGPGARMQIGMAIQQPAWMPWQQIRPDIPLDIQLEKRDIPLDMFESPVG
jgi:hypothetical protein